MTEKVGPSQAEIGNSTQANNSSVEREIELTKLRKEAAEAEIKVVKEEEKARKAAARAERINDLKGISAKKIVIPLVVLAAIIIAIPAFIIPMLSPSSQNQYLSSSDLEKVVNISKLSTVDYVYSGIADREPDTYGIGDWQPFEHGGYKIKYKAHVRANFDMSQIKFEVDNEAKSVTAYLPEPTLDTPRIDEASLGFLPESASGEMPELLKLCEEDVIQEVSQEGQIEERAIDNLKSVVTALTEHVIGDYTIEFVNPGNEKEQGESSEN